MKKTIIKIVKKMIKAIALNSLNLLALIVYGVYNLVRLFNNTITNLFNKFDRLVKVGVIYTLVFLSLITIVNTTKGFEIKKINNKTNNVSHETKVATTETKVEEKTTSLAVVTPNEKKQEEKKSSSCKYSKVECDIYAKGIEYGMTEKQAWLAVAISKHETGRWTSKAYKEYNNFGGLMTSKGLKKFNNYEEGLNAFVKLLKNRYYSKGLTTIESIQKVYAPVGAKNDPKNLNSNWVSGVKSFYNYYVK